MKHKKLFFSISFVILFPFIIFCSWRSFTPHDMPTQNIEMTPSHYQIKDEATHRELMRVSVNVYPGDELLTEENKLYRVVRTDEKTRYAYARYIKKLHPMFPSF